MPTLLLQGDGQDGSRLLARMCYPHNERQFARYLKRLAQGKTAGTDPVATSRRRAGVSKADNTYLLSVSETIWRGWTAGEVLVRVAAMEAFGTPNGGVLKAVYSLAKRGNAMAAPTTPLEPPGREDKALRVIERTYLNYFGHFANVRHFWAAHAYLEDRGVAFYWMPQVLEDALGLKLFLGLSVWFQNFWTGQQSLKQAWYRPREKRLAEGQGHTPIDPWIVSPSAEPFSPDLTPLRAQIEAETMDYVSEPTRRKRAREAKA